MGPKSNKNITVFNFVFIYLKRNVNVDPDNPDGPKYPVFIYLKRNVNVDPDNPDGPKYPVFIYLKRNVNQLPF